MPVGDNPLFESGTYPELIAVLSDRTDLSARETALLGISLLRTGDMAGAQRPLEIALALGDLEADVEYGNCLRATGHFEQAAAHLERLLPSLSGELRYRAQRWLGVTLFQSLHRAVEAQKFLEQARRGYRTLGHALYEAKVNQNLAVVCAELGDYRKARTLLQAAVSQFRTSQARSLLIQGLLNLIHLLLGSQQHGEVPALLAEAEALCGELPSLAHLGLWTCKATLLQNDFLRRDEYLSLLDRIHQCSEEFGDHEHLVWAIVRKVENCLQSGNTSEAMRMVYHSPQDEHGQFPISIRIVRAMINRRMGNLPEAIEELRVVSQSLEAAGNVAELARVRLQLAYALHLDDQLDVSADVLRAALQGLLRTNIHPSMRPELEELSELLYFAALEPSLAPYLEPVMDSLAGVLGGVGSFAASERVRLQVRTLGQIGVLRGGEGVTFQLRGTVPLLVYLALTPNRTRQEIQNDLYHDRDQGAGSSYVRKSIQELRETLGHAAVLTEGPRNHSRYRLGPSLEIDLDVTRFLDAVHGAQLARALAIYRGEFLPGTVDSGWVTQKRAEVHLALTFELHNQMVAFRERGEWRRVILLANQYLRVDPRQPDVHGLRVEAARKVGTSEELGRYVLAMHASSN